MYYIYNTYICIIYIIHIYVLYIYIIYIYIYIYIRWGLHALVKDSARVIHTLIRPTITVTASNLGK